MNYKEIMSNVIKQAKENTILLGYISSKYFLEILVSLIIVASYFAMFLSYGLMELSHKITIFINITYCDFDDYNLDKIVNNGVKQFYTKFPTMKKYFVTIKVKKEPVIDTRENNKEVIDLTSDDDEEEDKKNN